MLVAGLEVGRNAVEDTTAVGGVLLVFFGGEMGHAWGMRSTQ